MLILKFTTNKLSGSCFRIYLLIFLFSLTGSIHGQSKYLIQNITECDGVLVYFSQNNEINSLYYKVISEVIKNKFPIYNIKSRKEFLDSIVKDKKFIYFDLGITQVGRHESSNGPDREVYLKLVTKYFLNVKYGHLMKDSILGQKSIVRKSSNGTRYLLSTKSNTLAEYYYYDLDVFSDQISPVYVAAMLNGFVDNNLNWKDYVKSDVYRVYIDTLYFSEISYSKFDINEESVLNVKWMKKGKLNAYKGCKSVVSKHQISEIFLRRLKEGKSFFIYDFVLGDYKNNYIVWDAVKGVLYYGNKTSLKTKMKRRHIKKMNRQIRRG